MNLKEASTAVRDQGAAVRGEFVPEGVPARLYDYWLENTKTRKGRLIRWGDRRENFCHYWRVVLFWAPLMGIVRNLENGHGVAAGITLYVMLFASLSAFADPGFLFFIAVPWAVTSMILGCFRQDEPEEFSDAVPRAVQILFSPLMPIGYYFGFIIDQPSDSRWHLTWAIPLGLTLITGLGILAITLVSFLLTVSAGAWLSFGIFAGLALLGVGALTALIYGGYHLGCDAAVRYSDYRERAMEQRIAQYGPPPEPKPYTPGRISKFFSGVLDFVVLAFQIVRVNKWKICPLMEDRNDKSTA